MADTRKIFTELGINKLKALALKLTELQSEETLVQIQINRLASENTGAPINTAGETIFASSSSSLTAANKYVAQKNQFKSSTISQKMINAVLQMIDLVLNNNNIHFFLEEKNRARMNELALQIDSGKGIYAADIFNEQSYQLALVEKEFIETFNFQEYLQDFNTIKTLLNSFIDIEKTLDSIKHHLQLNCHLYEILLTAPKNYSLQKTYGGLVRQAYSAFTQKVNQFGQEANVQYYQGLANHLIPDPRPALRKDFFGKFEPEYTEFCEKYIKIISPLPYVRVAESGTLVDQESPYLLRKNDLTLLGLRAGLFVIMLDGEKSLNQALSKAELPLVTTVYDYLNKQYGEEKYEVLLEEFKQIIAAAETQFSLYKTGDHLKSKIDFGLFSFDVKIKTVDQGKITIFENCVQNMGEILKEKNSSIGEKVFSCAEVLFNAMDENKDVVSEKKISLGQLSKILNELTSQLLTLRFEKIDQTNDDGIGKKLKWYRKDLEIENSDDLKAESGKEAEKNSLRM